MQPNYSLWQRLRSATPMFFIRAQIFGISLAGLGTSLTQVNGIPPKITTVLISVGSTITIISQFAVKQYQPLNIQAHDDTK
ncbi:hypothetical protein ACFQZI_10080 [Mucilaginibacter lutimaris]|uniref:Uncharacterized protein n=1 Tax=Mucilaginibacter lutimaris TaxID=931629 RepID=A0ABW2ZG88_9SPHI